ncbi:MAG: hypothetical protein HC806_10610 [Anaerolineae bacterium]|nr:hypothetical protein [Anaerolineae bacterium]
MTVITTLGIAALFTPLRRRVQDFIDRRFFRKKYNAEQTLANFAVVARDEVDMDRLTAALLGVVEETMQPEKLVCGSRQANNMSNKSSNRIAWALCILIILGGIFASAFELRNRPADDNIFRIAEDVITVLAFGVFGVTGALIISRHPKNIIGWLLLFEGLLVFISPIDRYISNLTAAPRQPSTLMLMAFWLNSGLWALILFPLLFITLLFPTGHPPTRRWRWLIALGLGISLTILCFITFSTTFSSGAYSWSVTNPIGFLPSDSFPFVLFAIVTFSFAILCVASLFARFRQAGASEQQQIKWFSYAGSFFVFNLLLGILWGELGEIWAELGSALLFLAILFFPLSIAIAILRYRLYDIDVIIRRTLQYTLLTGLLALTYFGGIVIIQGILSPLTGSENSPLVTVITTLGIAALFTPLRHLVQEFIDRRFFRKKYNAEQTLAQFALIARDEVDMDKLTAALLGVVDETMQPEHASLWLRGRSSRS